MLEVLVLGVALSMDAFAVSVGLGSKKMQKASSLAVIAAIYFGLFQGLMPLVGYWGGKGVFGWVESYAHWVAWVLLLLVGVKMIYESGSEGIEEDLARVTHKVMVLLAIATSIDAMAAGFTLNLLDVDPFVACGLIGLTTSLFSWAGVYVGARSGIWLESKAEFLGGVILIGIGFKILLF